MSTSNPAPDATSNSGVPTDPQQLAQAVADAMWARDHATHAMGMTLVSVAPGSAVIHMTVRRDMLNGHGTCHGQRQYHHVQWGLGAGAIARANRG